MRHTSLLAICALATLSTASGAMAGGYVAPVADPISATLVVEAAPAGDWAGGYVGGSLGYSFGGDDVIGLDFYGAEDDDPVSRATELGAVDVKGVTAGLHLGYRWQRGRWVFGPELGYEGGSVDAEDRISGVATNGAIIDATVASEVNNILTLRLKTGYLMDDRTLVYGTAGAVRGDFDYTLADDEGSQTIGHTATGYALGLGAERKLTERLSAFAEWEYRNFGEDDIDFGNAEDITTTRATPDHHNVKVGVNFSF